MVALVIVGDVVWLLWSFRAEFYDWRARQRTGFVCRRHTDGSDYVVFIPHQLSPDEKLPLIVFLNGVGENGDDGVKQISNNFGSAVWELKARFPFAILATQCRIGGSWSPDSEDTRRLLDVLERTIDEYGIDPDRVLLTGPSAGGNGTWRLGAALADRFAAIAPLASAGCDIPEEEAVRAYAAVNMPVWSFCNRGDVPALVEFNRRMHAQLVAAGLDARLTEYDADGHDCWTDAYRSPALYDWLWRQSRKSRARVSKYQPFFETTPLSEWTFRGGTPRFDDEVLAVDSDTELLAPRALQNSEVRLELMCEGVVPLEIILRHGNAANGGTQDVRGVIDWPQNGSGGILLHGDGWIGAVNPVAQRSLASGHWNDVQLVLSDGRIAVWLNGLLLTDAVLPGETADDWQVGLALRPEHRVRALRWRPLTTERGN